MESKVCYRYNKVNYSYVGEDEAFESAVHPGQYDLPANCTFIQPPSFIEKEIPVFINGEWLVYPDYRTTDLYKKDDLWWSEVYHTNEIGPIPEGFTTELIDKPSDVLDCASLILDVDNSNRYLDGTDKNYIELQAYKMGYRQYLTDDDIKEMEAIEQKRDEVASSIRSKKSKIAELKSQIAVKYGDEALNHLF